MYMIYFPYAIAVAVWVLIDSGKRNVSRLWSLPILFSPVLTSLYLFRTRPGKSLVPIVIAVVSLVCVGIGEYTIDRIYYRETLTFSNYSPIAKKMIELSQDLKASTTTLDDAIEKLEGMSRVESKLQNMGKTIQLIGDMRVLMIRNKQAELTLISFAKEYREILEQDGMEWLLTIETYYNNRVVLLHEKKLNEYLDAFEALLQFIFEHYYKIHAQDIRTLNNYDAYYMNYRRAVDSHNAINIKRITYQDSLLEEHPGLKPYLPSIRQIDFLIF